jgi:hypothetical protein
MRSALTALTILAASCLAIPKAHADEDTGYGKDDWPLRLIQRPLVLAGSMLEVRGDTLRIELSDGSALEPISLAPDLFYGINKKWTVGVTHDTGICLTGSDGGCPKAYNDFGLEAQFSLMGRGSFQLAATGSLTFASLSDPNIAGLRFGFLTRLRAGKMAVFARPNIYVGITERDTLGDILDIPVDLQFQLNAQTAVAVESGVVGPLDGFGDAYEIPIGLSALFAVSEKIDFGAAFRFTNLAGKGATIDGRELIGRMALRL